MIDKNIDLYHINKIFSNGSQKKDYLNKLYLAKNLNKKIPKGINNEIIETWEYELSNEIIRKIFRETDKYKVGKESKDALKEMRKEWNQLGLGEFSWPFLPIIFDQYIQSVNKNKSLTEEEKDKLVQSDIVKFRRIKKINTARNDYIEYLIVENNENVTPTLKHNKGIDFYINGIPFDQKVSRSVTKDFMADYGDNWKNAAIKHPDIVAKYLYKYQDEARFGYEARLLIVYLDDDITDDDIYECVNKTNFKEPLHISFEYKYKNGNIETYNTDCYVVLVSKQNK